MFTARTEVTNGIKELVLPFVLSDEGQRHKPFRHQVIAIALKPGFCRNQMHVCTDRNISSQLQYVREGHEVCHELLHRPRSESLASKIPV